MIMIFDFWSKNSVENITNDKPVIHFSEDGLSNAILNLSQVYLTCESVGLLCEIPISGNIIGLKTIDVLV